MSPIRAIGVALALLLPVVDSSMEVHRIVRFEGLFRPTALRVDQSAMS
jgi:hypothetical protein